MSSVEEEMREFPAAQNTRFLLATVKRKNTARAPVPVLPPVNAPERFFPSGLHVEKDRGKIKNVSTGRRADRI